MTTSGEEVLLQRRRGWIVMSSSLVHLKAVTLLLSLVLMTSVFEATSADLPAHILITDVSGLQHDLMDKNWKATVLFFVSADCPISNSYAPEIRRMIDAYRQRQVAFFMIYVDPTVPIPEIEKHAKEYEWQVPVILDQKHFLVELSGVAVTPEVALFDPGGKVRYRGRIDDLYYDYGKRRTAPTKQDITNALDAILNGRPVAAPAGKPIGCFITSVN